MGYKAIISPVAKFNVREAVAYYKKVASLKVAQNFVKDYELTLQTILRSPFFKIYYKDFRGLPFKKYPYVIFYQIDEEQKLIYVKGVLHGRQNTSKRPV